jgi:hypothetical protein
MAFCQEQKQQQTLFQRIWVTHVIFQGTFSLRFIYSGRYLDSTASVLRVINSGGNFLGSWHCSKNLKFLYFVFIPSRIFRNFCAPIDKCSTILLDIDLPLDFQNAAFRNLNVFLSWDTNHRKNFFFVKQHFLKCTALFRCCWCGRNQKEESKSRRKR